MVAIFCCKKFSLFQARNLIPFDIKTIWHHPQFRISTTLKINLSQRIVIDFNDLILFYVQKDFAQLAS